MAVYCLVSPSVTFSIILFAFYLLFITNILAFKQKQSGFALGTFQASLNVYGKQTVNCANN
jgi:hypothetical protein